MKDSYEIRIERTVDLAERSDNVNGRILLFYARLLMFQYSVLNELKASGRTELDALADYFPKLRGEGDGGKRSLICSLCATEWQYRRIKCPNCGEEDKEKLS